MLAEAVPQVVELDYPKKDGSTLRGHLESYSRQTGRHDERLDPPDIPVPLVYLWEWFWQLVGGMGDSGFWITLQAWQEVTSNRLTPWEAETMGRMYDKYQRAMSEKLKEK